VNFLALLDHFFELDHPLISEIFQVSDLSLHAGESVPVQTFHFLVCFDSIGAIVFFSDCQGDHRKGALSDVREDFEVFECL